MISNFWQELPKPLFVLAPLANVTDCAFRSIIAKYGKPDVMWTEFVSCDGLQSPGRQNLMIDLQFSAIEHPIVAQIFGSQPDNFYKTAILCAELGFDGIDINMGCPDRNVEKQCAGAAMMKDPPLAQACIAATLRGAGKLPVSVKTRLGFNKNELATWLPTLLATNLAAITIHARTRQEMSLVPANWEEVAAAVKIRDHHDSSKTKTLILGNGDVTNLDMARRRVNETGCDGIMIGRGIFGNPWLFKDKENYRNKDSYKNIENFKIEDNKNENYKIENYKNENEISTIEKLRVMVEHTYLFEKLLGQQKSFSLMKKHYKVYVNGFDGAKELRVKLMEEAIDANAVEQVVNAFLQSIPP